uniref:Uncharacterized protein n=1 Tax=Molossus molossus TaxID=27622 RepID=A0A7J8GQ55_MOLMO|nr:hypothetical protein HJG59_011302 [Molossus molossus]
MIYQLQASPEVAAVENSKPMGDSEVVLSNNTRPRPSIWSPVHAWLPLPVPPGWPGGCTAERRRPEHCSSEPARRTLKRGPRPAKPELPEFRSPIPELPTAKMAAGAESARPPLGGTVVTGRG